MRGSRARATRSMQQGYGPAPAATVAPRALYGAPRARARSRMYIYIYIHIIGIARGDCVAGAGEGNGRISAATGRVGRAAEPAGRACAARLVGVDTVKVSLGSKVGARGGGDVVLEGSVPGIHALRFFFFFFFSLSPFFFAFHLDFFFLFCASLQFGCVFFSRSECPFFLPSPFCVSLFFYALTCLRI